MRIEEGKVRLGSLKEEAVRKYKERARMRWLLLAGFWALMDLLGEAEVKEAAKRLAKRITKEQPNRGADCRLRRCCILRRAPLRRAQDDSERPYLRETPRNKTLPTSRSMPAIWCHMWRFIMAGGARAGLRCAVAAYGRPLRA